MEGSRHPLSLRLAECPRVQMTSRYPGTSCGRRGLLFWLLGRHPGWWLLVLRPAIALAAPRSRVRVPLQGWAADVERLPGRCNPDPPGKLPCQPRSCARSSVSTLCRSRAKLFRTSMTRLPLWSSRPNLRFSRSRSRIRCLAAAIDAEAPRWATGRAGLSCPVSSCLRKSLMAA